MKTVFISGPMTGLPDNNYSEFFRVEKLLRDVGYSVVNPASIGVHDGWEWRDYMTQSLMMLLTRDVDAVVTLDGWERSKGASLEVYVARALGMDVVSAYELLRG